MSSPRIRRLESDYERVKSRFNGWHLIELKATEGSPPEKYCIMYYIRGLYTDSDGKILERDQHRLVISLGLEYPRRPPQLRLMTPIFHPNFNQTEVCAQDNYASSEGLDDLIIRIGQMISYQFYNTKSPLNGLAAKWAEENSSRLPVDKREIGPPQINVEQESQAIPVQVISEVEQKTRNIDNERLKDILKEEVNMGVDLLKNGKFHESLKMFNSIIEETEIIKHVYYYRAVALSKIGNKNMAIDDLIVGARLGDKKSKEILTNKKIQY